jgi:hypothetical protein
MLTFVSIEDLMFFVNFFIVAGDKELFICLSSLDDKGKLHSVEFPGVYEKTLK